MGSFQAPSPSSRFGLILLGVSVVLILGLLWVVQRLPAPRKPGPTAAVGPLPGGNSTGSNGGIGTAANALASPAAAGAADEASRQAAEKAAIRREAVAQVSKAIDAALAGLRDPANPDKTAALAALRTTLRQAEPAAAVAAMRQFLAGREDAATGLGFKVGPNGVLVDAPTLRTFMMDQLGIISGQAGLADAAEAGRETLGAMTSSDEWALAMRNVAWADPSGSKAFLAGKVREMIAYTPWQQQPSPGFLEAFDVAAYTGDASLFNDLAPLAREPSALQQAALVAMDRLSALAPEAAANYLNSHPDLLADRPLVRADYMGKLDLSDSAQQADAVAYLQRADVSFEEKSKFLARLGLPAGFVSNNLLTPAQTQPADLFTRRTVVNQTATNWLNSGQFPALQAPLQKLVTFTAPGT